MRLEADDDEPNLEVTRILSASDWSFRDAVALVGSCHISSISVVEAIRTEERKFAKWICDIAKIVGRSDDPDIVTRHNLPERLLHASNASHDRRDEWLRKWVPPTDNAH